MRIVNNPVDYRGQMFRDANHQSPSWQFVAPQMHGASRTDLHRRRPHPAQRLHDSFNRRFINARSSVALSTFPFAGALVGRRAVHQVIDLLIRPPGRNRYGPNNTIAGLAPISSSPAPSIIKLKMSAHISFRLSLARISISLPVSRIRSRSSVCTDRRIRRQGIFSWPTRQRCCSILYAWHQPPAPLIFRH
jgi:hypothetical protein